MAEGETNTALQKLKDQITCSICLKTYIDPKVLPCLHVNCQKCLKSLQLRSIDNKTIQCPSCRQSYKTDAASLQPAFFIHSYIDGYNAMKKALESNDITPPHCVNCPDSEAVVSCKECEENFCKSCQKAHGKKSKKHTTTKIKKEKGGDKTKGKWRKDNKKGDKIVQSDGPQNPALSSAAENVNICPAHPGEELKVYCETCNTQICRDCTVSDHRTHDYYLAAEAAARRKNYILSSLKPIEKEVRTIEAALVKVKAELVQVKTKGERVKEEVRDKIEKMQSALEERKLTVLSQLDRVVSKKVEILSTQENELTTSQAESASFIKSTHVSLDTSTDEELMAVKVEVAKQVGEILTAARMVSKEPKEKTEISLLFNDQLLADCKQYGIILSKPADLFCIGKTVKSSPLLKEVSVPIHIALLRQNIGSINIQQMVTTGRNKKNVIPSRLVKKHGTDTFQVLFSSPIRGSCFVHATVNNEDIRESPASLFLYTPTPSRVIKLDKPDMVAVTIEWIVVVGDSRKSVAIYSKPGNEILCSFQLKNASPYPRGVAIYNEDFLLVTDRSDSSITKYKLSGSVAKTVGREGDKPLQFSGSCGIAVDKKTGKIYVADQNNHRIQVLNSDLTFSHMFGVKGQRPGEFDQPRDVAVIEDGGEVFVADRSNHRIQAFTPGGSFIREFGKKGDGNGELNLPVGLCIDPSSQYVLVTDFGNDRISVFSCQGAFITSFGKRGALPGEFTSPYGITIDNEGFIYVADYANNRIQIF